MYWNLGGSRKKHRLQWKTYMGVCVCVRKSLLNLKLTTSMDWSKKRKKKKGDRCPEIKLWGSTENKQPQQYESVTDISYLSLTTSKRQVKGPSLHTSAAF